MRDYKGPCEFGHDRDQQWNPSGERDWLRKQTEKMRVEKMRVEKMITSSLGLSPDSPERNNRIIGAFYELKKSGNDENRKNLKNCIKFIEKSSPFFAKKVENQAFSLDLHQRAWQDGQKASPDLPEGDADTQFNTFFKKFIKNYQLSSQKISQFSDECNQMDNFGQFLANEVADGSIREDAKKWWNFGRKGVQNCKEASELAQQLVEYAYLEKKEWQATSNDIREEFNDAKRELNEMTSGMRIVEKVQNFFQTFGKVRQMQEDSNTHLNECEENLKKALELVRWIVKDQ